MKKSEFSLGGKKPDIEINTPADGRSSRSGAGTSIAYLVMMLLLFLFWRSRSEYGRQELAFSDFLGYVKSDMVADAVLGDDLISGTLKPEAPPLVSEGQAPAEAAANEPDPSSAAEGAAPAGDDEAAGDANQSVEPRPYVTIPPRDFEVAELLAEHGVHFSARPPSGWLSTLFFVWIAPLLIFGALWVFLSRRMGGSRGFLNLGPNRIHIHPETDIQVTFDDVAGADAAKMELREVVGFLRDPTRIRALGGHMPKGVLLVGAPGTGKTLLARAVAGEAEVPFFNISGSEFIEMFVGVGAARVRDLFHQAREKAPCIVFIDELDAIGRARGIGPVMGGHDEREQTLNQLLVEMDGFDPSEGVAVLSATNRPEILDKALLRAGRFDRQIVVDKPDLEGRVAILRIHVRELTLADDVDLEIVAQRTPGFVGSDLANIANEAAIHAVREGHDQVTMEDFEAAIDRVIAGPEKKHGLLGPREKHRVAFHESGHTLVAKTVPSGEPVHKVSIIPRGVGALGYTLQLPTEEKFLSTKSELEDQITILLGGRAAEEIVFGDVSTGAQNDLERASAIAHQMVCQLGMSQELGPVIYGKESRSVFLGVEGPEERNFSEQTAQHIDAEVLRIVRGSHERALEILEAHRASLDALASQLENKESLDGDEVDAILTAAGPD